MLLILRVAGRNLAGDERIFNKLKILSAGPKFGLLETCGLLKRSVFMFHVFKRRPNTTLEVFHLKHEKSSGPREGSL